MTSTSLPESQLAPPLQEVAPGLISRVRPGQLSAVANGLLGVGFLCVLVTLITYLTSGGDHAHGAEGEAADHVSTAAQAASSYAVAFTYGLGIGLGAMFFVMVQHIVRAGWSVLPRRVFENMMGAFSPWMIILFIPLAIMAHDVYHHWWHFESDPTAEKYDAILDGKKAYLNPTAFYIRAVVYFALWVGFARFFRNNSLKQDETGDATLTTKMTNRAAPGLVAFALTTTFASIDWIMSIDPHWYSTIFGVTYFAGAVVVTLAIGTLLILFLQGRGYLKEINSEHFHDLGKLLFAFMVFWTYTNFSQFMLIWYGNIPEETLFFQHRKEWNGVFMLLAIGHFLAPFAFLMSRHMKRNKLALSIAAVWLCVMHWFDLQYLVMPELHHHFHPSWLDATAMIGVLGVLIGGILRNIAATPLVPERDPRLRESLKFHNV